MSIAAQNVLSLLYTKMCVFPQAIKDNADFVGGKDSTPVTADTSISGVKAEFARGVVAVGATDVTMAAMNVFESDDDSTYTEIAGLDFVNDSTPPGPGDDNTLWRALIDLRTKKRYLQWDLAAGNGTSGTYAVAWFDFYALNEAPNTAAEAGFTTSLSA